MGNLVSDAEVASYRRDGAVLIKGLFDQGWLNLFAEGIEENLRRPSQRTHTYVDDPADEGRFFFDARIKGEVEAYDDLVLNAPMAETVARLMGSSQAIFFYMTVFVRAPGTRTPSPWHQDQPSWSAEGEQACSLWMPLDPVPRETALEFVRGSHRWTTAYGRPAFFDSRYEDQALAGTAPFPDIEAHREDYEILAWDMAPGDCLVFHGMTAHGGSGNLPPGLGRRALSVQWLGDDARFRHPPGGDDPPIGVEVMRHGVKPGDPLTCDICPVAWPRG